MVYYFDRVVRCGSFCVLGCVLVKWVCWWVLMYCWRWFCCVVLFLCVCMVGWWCSWCVYRFLVCVVWVRLILVVCDVVGNVWVMCWSYLLGCCKWWDRCIVVCVFCFLVWMVLGCVLLWFVVWSVWLLIVFVECGELDCCRLWLFWVLLVCWNRVVVCLMVYW